MKSPAGSLTLATLGCGAFLGWLTAAMPSGPESRAQGAAAGCAWRKPATIPSTAPCCRFRNPRRPYHRARCPERQGPSAVRGEGAGRRSQRAHRADRRHGVRPVERLRRADPHAHGGASGQERAPLQPVSHDGALLADPCRAAFRPQPSHVQHGLDHRDGHRLPRPNRAAAQQRGAAGRDAASQRLRHRRLRQVARDRGLGSQPFGPDQSLADPLRLRQVLRVHRRRGQPVGTGDLRRDEPGSSRRRIRITIS